MAYFAKVGRDYKVEKVIAVANEVLLDSNGVEQEQLGIDLCNSIEPGNWIQTSYNGTIRRTYAGIDSLYIAELDAFTPPQEDVATVFNRDTWRWEQPNE